MCIPIAIPCLERLQNGITDGWLVFGLPIVQYLPGIAIMILVTAYACSSFGIVLASFARTRQQVQGLSTIVVLVMSGVGFVDSSALRTLQVAVENLRAGGVTIHLADVKGPVMDRLRRTKIFEHLAPGQVFPTPQVAVSALTRAAEREKELIPI